MALVDEVVVDSTRRPLVISLVDRDGSPIDITGGDCALQGVSDALPGVEIDEDLAGGNVEIVSGPQGLVKFKKIGTYVTAINLGTLKRATYTLRVKYIDVSNKFDYTPAFNIAWVAKPV